MPKPNTFTLTLSLGDDGMLTNADIIDALQDVAGVIRADNPGGYYQVPKAEIGKAILDCNGNKVGRWALQFIP